MLSALRALARGKLRAASSVLLVLAFLAAAPAHAFSPYELYLQSGGITHVGLLATIRPEQEENFAAALARLEEFPIAAELADCQIFFPRAFTRTIEGRPCVVIHFAFGGIRDASDYLRAAEMFERATKSIDWGSIIEPHPRAKRYGRTWLQMEWINFIRGVEGDGEPTDVIMIGTTVIPEKEFQYRTLHQTTWPGVVDQAVRGKIRNLCIFLVELDDQLVEFLYLEYAGDDADADDAANKADPINQRWWKLTDECQRPFSDVTDGVWAPLERVDAALKQDETTSNDHE